MLFVGGSAVVTFRGAQFLHSSGTLLKVFDKARVALTNGTTFANNTKGPALVVTGDAMVTVLGAAFTNNSAQREDSGGWQETSTPLPSPAPPLSLPPLPTPLGYKVTYH